MSHQFRFDEPPAFRSGTAAQRRRAGEAVHRIFQRAEDEPAYVVALLEAAAEAVEEYEISQALPDAERGLWQRLGARFPGSSAVGRDQARMADAFARLVERSVVGDDAMASHLGVSRSRVSQRVAERSLYVFSGPHGERCFPRWQLVGSKPVRGLQRVLAALDVGLHPLAVDHWFTTPS